MYGIDRSTLSTTTETDRTPFVNLRKREKIGASKSAAGNDRKAVPSAD